MPATEVITDPDDPRLDDFRALNDPATRREVERRGDYFVVEGVLAIERLLDLPHWEVRTLALLPRVAERLAARTETSGAPVVVADQAVLQTVVGFHLHRGALASVRRRPPVPVAQLARSGGREVLVALQGVNDHENLGAIYRNAAAFGAAGVVLDERCADPFYRRSVRVSLGHVLGVPTATAAAGAAGIEELHAAGVVTVALSPSAAMDLAELDVAALGPGPVALVLGAEGPGLADDALAAAHHRVAIPMAPGVDSLNVATTAAVALWALQRRGQ